MHSRAISLLSRSLVAIPVQTNFSLTLQAAASRAWLRRVSTSAPTTTGVKAKEPYHDVYTSPQIPVKDSPLTSQENSSEPSTSHIAPAIAPPSAQSGPKPWSYQSPTPDRQSSSVEFHPESSNEHARLGRANALPPLSETSPTTRPSSAVNFPHTAQKPSRTTSWRLRPNEFVQELTRLAHYARPNPTLPTIIDYHNQHPELHSARSYNIVIALSLQHSAFSTCRSLFLAMRASRIERNVETWKLEIRYLVDIGLWDTAWARAQEYHHEHRSDRTDGDPVPLFIWLELFGTPRRGVSPSSTRSKPVEPSRENGASPSRDPFLLSAEDSRLWNRRVSLLFDAAPKVLSDFRQVQPYVVRKVVTFLLRLGYRENALTLTQGYLRSMPSIIESRAAQVCTDIVNLHVSFGSTKKGLAKWKESEALLQSLLDLNSSLRPNSDTLFLLLSPLRHAKKCGTMARTIALSFGAKWGDELVDHRVKRRVVTLALKQGRHDIARQFMVSPKEITHGLKSSSGSGSSQQEGELKRLPRRETFERVGREKYLWHELNNRIRPCRRSKEDDTLK
ncbi:hypothetical protein D9611_003133 [Ephemerocybe angulata]|uniref:Uncharacterized protein n=1 Tax=Ephemerocybe angulata TaxID=980116 RepID=A0A8H5FH70_9AGAR|nr:hypothetical protein D9611_003133 [Tulosesus angulatus]